MREDIVILIAEDDQGHFVLAKHCLRRGGIANDIIWLQDGQKTLDFLFGLGDGGNERPRDGRYVLLLDIRMPKLDGIEILRQVKSDKELKDIPVIVVTTSDSAFNIDLCRSLGCDGYIVKPIDETLVDTVRKLCSAM